MLASGIVPLATDITKRSPMGRFPKPASCSWEGSEMAGSGYDEHEYDVVIIGAGGAATPMGCPRGGADGDCDRRRFVPLWEEEGEKTSLV